jgi:hypothetical protein
VAKVVSERVALVRVESRSAMSVRFAHLCRNSFSRTEIFHLQYQVFREGKLVKIDQTFRSTVELARPLGAIGPKVVQISYSNDMDHLTVFRDKIGRLREEIADIQVLNEQFRREGWNEAEVKSLMDRGTNGCKRSSLSLFDLPTLVAKLSRQNK